MKAFFTCMYILCGFGALAGGRLNDHKITGRLLDETQNGVPFTTVLLVNAGDTALVKGALTDSLGGFEIAFSDTGRFMVVAEIGGYKKYFSDHFTIDANNKNVSLGDIALVPETGNTLGEVTITTQKKFIDMQAGKLVITPDNSPISSGSTAYDVLKRSPGVSIDQNQNLTLKGKTNVMVFIDDKPTYMTQDQLMTYLRNMPSSQIATIEIINNPGARYDASGNSGIINIRTKKLKNKGYNGSVRVSGGYGWYHKANAGVQLNYRNNKVNVFGSYGHNNSQNGNRNELDREIPVADGTTLFDQYFEDVSTDIGHSFKFGADFYLTQKSTVGFLLKGNNNPSSSILYNTTEIKGYNPMGFARLEAKNESETPYNSYTANLNFAHTFDSLGQKKLNVDLDFSPFKSNSSGTYFTRYYDAGNNEILTPQDIRSTNFSDVTIYAGKVDYSQPLGKTMNLEAGVKSSYVTIDNGINFKVNSNGTLIDDTTRNNDFAYDENINAAYASLSKQYKKFSYVLGLRTEHTHNKGYSKTLDSTVTRDYVNLFPSVNLSWDIDSINNLNLAYSRRIDRPSYQDLNPFLYFADQYSFMKGNPFLKPQFTHGISLTHTFMQFLFTTIGSDITNDYMAEIIEQDTASKVSFITKTNFKNFTNYYVNIGAGAPIKSLFLTFNFTGYYSRFKTQYNQYQIDNSQFTYSLYMAASYSFKHNWKAEVSGFYNSKSIYGIFKISPMYMMEAGIKKSFPKAGIDINLSVNDVFNTMRNSITMNDNGMNATFRNKWESRRAMLTLTWNFGKQDIKSRKRNTATEDEQNRINKGGGGGMGK